MIRLATSLVLGLTLVVGCGGGGGNGKTRLAFVTNCAVDFWTVAEAGVKAAAEEYDVEVIVRMPPNGTPEEQKRMLEDVVSAGVSGVAVSPKDPDNMTGLLDRIADRCLLITHDSDAPSSKRLCYIGVDNYDAGRMCGELIERALPDGGGIVLVVGTLDQDNARRRRQGVIDHLLGRSHDPSRFDPQEAVLKNDKYEILATFTDQMLAQKGKEKVEDALTKYQSGLDCFCGLFAYEPPVMIDAVRAAGRLDEIKIVGFDEDFATLQGIKDGTVFGTVVQNPYEYGRKSVELLAKLAKEPDTEKRKALLPPGGVVDVEARQITKENVDEFWADLKKKVGK